MLAILVAINAHHFLAIIQNPLIFSKLSLLFSFTLSMFFKMFLLRWGRIFYFSLFLPKRGIPPNRIFPVDQVGKNYLQLFSALPSYNTLHLLNRGTNCASTKLASPIGLEPGWSLVLIVSIYFRICFSKEMRTILFFHSK